MVKEMLGVLMDGIKDADMLFEYASKAKAMEDDTYEWFMNHARNRVSILWEDYKAINKEINLEQKAMEGDVIAAALMEHLKCEIDRLKMKI